MGKAYWTNIIGGIQINGFHIQERAKWKTENWKGIGGFHIQIEVVSKSRQGSFPNPGKPWLHRLLHHPPSSSSHNNDGDDDMQWYIYQIYYIG